MATTTQYRDNKEIARRYPEAVATGRDLDLIEELETADFVEHGPFGEETRGPAADREQMAGFLEAFPDLEAEVEEVIGEGDLVAMRVTLRGTHDGPFMGIDPTGRGFEVQNMVFTRLEDGKIAERWVQPDTLGMLTQLGIIELPEAFAG